MTARSYFRWSLVAPLVVPFLAILAAVASQWAVGSREATQVSRLAVFLAHSLQVGGLPHLLFLTGALVWSRGKGAAAIRRFTFVAPVWFALVFATLWVPFALYLGWAAPHGILNAFASGGLLALYCLGLGYAYVVVDHVGYAILERRDGVGHIGNSS